VPVGSAYAPFFFGVIELSSIPLVIVPGSFRVVLPHQAMSRLLRCS
jgi:hypothetical protein